MSLSRPLRLFLLLLPLLGGLLLSMDWAGRQARQQALRAEGEQVRKQLDLYAGSLQTLIERFRSLPAVLALDPDLRAALAGPIDGELQQRLNLKLESINLAARSSTLELLDRTGLAVAASNWNLPTSYVGHNYGFRPYFRQTIAQGSGRFYAVGVISGIPGYFLSHAVRAEDGSFLGAIVVKLEFPDLERQWNQTPDLVLASDAKGIVFLANHAGWRYRELEPLDTVDRFELAETRQYDRQPLTPRIVRQAERGEIDLAFHTLEEAPPGLRCRRLFSERYVLAGRAGHPGLRRRPTLKQFCRLEQAIVSPDGGGFLGPTDQALAELGAERRVALSVPHFLFLRAVLESTDLVALLPSRLVRERDRLRVVEAPLEVSGYDLAMLWHERSHRDPAHRWLRELIAASV